MVEENLVFNHKPKRIPEMSFSPAPE